MVEKMRSLIYFVILASLLALIQAYTPAPLVLQKRATYNGGWALAIPGTTCPADAPVACPTEGGNCQLVSRVWLPLALLLETSSDRQHIRPPFSRPLLVL